MRRYNSFLLQTYLSGNINLYRSIAIATVLIGFSFTAAHAEQSVVSEPILPPSFRQQFQVIAPSYTGAPLGALNACDLNGDGKVDVTDVQLAVNQATGLSSCADADLHLNNTCTVLDVQVIVSAVETGSCLVPNCNSPLTYPNTNTYPSTAPACPPTLPANPNPPDDKSQDDGPIHPCMYVQNDVRFQAIQVTGVSGNQALNADLYEGASCNPNDLVDEVFNGVDAPFYGDSLYWLIHFWDEPSTSAIWTVGNITTQCIDYSKVSDCN